MNNRHKIEIDNMLKSKILFDEPLSKHTSFGIGGPANCLIFPNSANELSKLLKYVNKNKIPIVFIGSGSNLLIWDKGFNGIVISLKKTFKKLIINKTNICSESGVMLGTMVKNAIK